MSLSDECFSIPELPIVLSIQEKVVAACKWKSCACLVKCDKISKRERALPPSNRCSSVMESEYEESVLSILRGREGWDDMYDEIAEFKEQLKEAALAAERVGFGWVLRRAIEQKQELDLYHHSNYTTLLQHQIITIFEHIALEPCFSYHYLVQFWAVVKVEGQNHIYLSTSHQPFSVGKLTKGLCWYRRLCMDHVCHVEEGADEEQLGSIGRAYRNKYPESTPDLRLYSTNEYPMRDEAARCGLRGYMALPLFDVHNSECYGVLELVSGTTIGAYQLSSLDQGLQFAGLRSTHFNFIPISQSRIDMPDKYKQQPESEITEMLELAIMEVPQLYLAQVWVPCKQCANLICRERACFINTGDKTINLCKDIDEDMLVYLQACEFHNLQVDPNYFDQNLWDLSISNNPLAHYAKRARLSHCFAICLQSVDNNSNYFIEFFLQPKCRQDGACGDSSLRLISRIFEMKLKNFKFLSREQFPEESVQSSQPIAIEHGSVDMLNVMNSYMESLSESNFTACLETVDSCCLRPSSEDNDQGWVFCCQAGERLCESDVDSNSSTVPKILVKEKIKKFMKRITAGKFESNYWIVQFWAPKMVGGRSYLETLDQPYALGCLAKGLASLRKKCIKHRYFVDEEAEEEELGPPGRVFRIGNPEITPDLFHYTKKEFPIRNYAIHCCLQQYFALPIFDDDEHNHKCVGVLELIGFSISTLEYIISALKEEALCSMHIDFSPICLENDKPANMSSGREQALSEVREAFLQITNIPQLYMAEVWVPYETCTSINSNARCMALALSTKNIWLWYYMTGNQVRWIHVQPGKGIIGMLLESESKACFCRNLCEFSIGDQPLAHNQRRERLDVCFAICLQSSHTEDLLYVVEFILYQSPENLFSFLNFLIPIMKQQLKSFKYASGKQIGEKLVVEVIEFSEANNTLTSPALGQPHPFPIKFKSVRYGQMEHQQAEDQPVQCVSDVTQTEQCNTAASCSKTTKRAKGKTGSRLSFEKLKPHFGKKLQDVADELEVGRSTIKRACRENGIDRWPSKKENKKNPSLFERESGRDSEEEAEKVMVKVKYKEDTIKFELCLPLGVAKLFQEVATGLNMKMATFKLKYLDEDNDEILLTRDADFQYCPRSQTATGKTCIKLFVQLISE